MTPAQRREFLSQSKAHFAADMLLKGTYADEDAGDFKGCSVGCHLHHIKPKWTVDQVANCNNKHALVAKHYGYPEWLALLQDTIFECLPNGESARWHVQLAETLAKLPTKYDWQAALHRVHIALLRVAYKTAGSAQAVVQQVIDLRERAERGERVVDELRSAASAAWSAASAAWSAAWSAASAAWSAASAARSAESAAWSAAWSAESAAWSAAWSAESAAWSAAWSAAYQEIRDGILAAIAND